MFFDDEISRWWCLGDTWRCTPSEAAGLWTVILFYATTLFVTVAHSVIQSQNGTAGRNEEATRRHTAKDAGDDLGAVCLLLVYFFSLAAGSLLWVAAGVRWVHPVQIWQLQVVGSVILVSCAVLFVAVHVDMGENWSPQPEQKARHQLVTGGVFRWAKHPMYAVFLWASIGTLLATLNWFIAWCVFGSVLVTLRRIETEERILVELFGGQYLEYRQRVSALGPPWRCLGFDREMRPYRKLSS
jgi:protein-S-isoprenylcysteine O-methyltransferase Ste14